MTDRWWLGVLVIAACDAEPPPVPQPSTCPDQREPIVIEDFTARTMCGELGRGVASSGSVSAADGTLTVYAQGGGGFAGCSWPVVELWRALVISNVTLHPGRPGNGGGPNINVLGVGAPLDLQETACGANPAWWRFSALPEHELAVACSPDGLTWTIADTAPTTGTSLGVSVMMGETPPECMSPLPQACQNARLSVGAIYSCPE